MQIRHYRPGDERLQAELYNQAAAGQPGFKPATAEEIARRYRASDPDPTSKLYAAEDDRLVGYIVFNPNGRISHPWCLPEAQDARETLLEAALAVMHDRGHQEAWAAYQSNWTEIIDFFKRHGFHVRREMVNYVAEVSRLPGDEVPVPEGRSIAPLARSDVASALEMGGELFRSDDPNRLEGFFFENAHIDPCCTYALKRTKDGRTLGLALAIINPRYSDPTKVDPAMPCFRLGALGTENQRHKRINGLFSCVFSAEEDALVLLAEAARRFKEAGLTHAAAQAPSDRPELCAFYDRYFQRQGSFPILARRLTAGVT